MLRPLGSALITIDLCAERRRRLAAPLRTSPRWRSRARFAGPRATGREQRLHDELAVLVDRGREHVDRDRSEADGCDRAVRSRWRCWTSSDSFRPPAAKIFTPLSRVRVVRRGDHRRRQTVPSREVRPSAGVGNTPPTATVRRRRPAARRSGRARVPGPIHGCRDRSTTSPVPSTVRRGMTERR